MALLVIIYYKELWLVQLWRYSLWLVSFLHCPLSPIGFLGQAITLLPKLILTQGGEIYGVPSFAH